MRIFKLGSDDADDILLNPAHVLLSKKASTANQDVCKAFMGWVKAENGGQKVIEHFEKDGNVLYKKAPRSC